MIVRPAHPDDAGAICDIWNHYVRNSAATFTTDEKTLTGITEDIIVRDGAFFVAVDDGEVIGFATYFPFRGGPGYAYTKEHSIMLSPNAAGKGAGRALMEALCKHARSAGVHSLWAGISGENPKAVAFHAALGFVEVAQLPEVGRKFDRWMDLILMQKRL